MCNDIMIPVCGLKLCEVKTWEHFRLVRHLGTLSKRPPIISGPFFSKSYFNRLRWFCVPNGSEMGFNLKIFHL